MYDQFFDDIGFDKHEREAVCKNTVERVMIERAQDAVRLKDQKRFVSLCTEAGPLSALTLFAACYPLTMAYYRDEAIRKATISDLLVWVRRYEKETGSVGMNRYRWLAHHACGTIVKLGRLQFETATYDFDTVISRKNDGALVVGNPVGSTVILAKGMPALRLHVPEGEPLSPSLVDASLSLAHSFFPAFPVAVCDSWLLDPQLELVASPSSHIISFLRRFTKFPIPMEGEPQVFERVFAFGAGKADVLSFSCTTTLQENIKQAVALGVCFRNTAGFVAL